MSPALPGHADVVVVGGGIIGCSTAYHLARDHKVSVVLIEQGRLTGGSSWHAAGLVGQLRSSASITQVLRYSVELYKALEAETGLATGWRQTGCLRLACNADRWIEFKRQATTAHSFGLEMELLSAAEAKVMWPLLEVDDLVGATFLPSDGQAGPSDITQSLAKGARLHGARIFEGITCTGFEIGNGRVAGVQTDAGAIATEKVVVCAGMWSRQIGALAGVSVPLQAVQHQYVVTEKIDGVVAGMPTIRDPDRRTYFKEEVGGLAFGGYEPDPVAWENEIPGGFEFQLLDDNWGHFEQHLEHALARIPALAGTGIKQMINGPESFTPDGNFILGEAPEVRGFFVGAGFNAFGIASAGGAGWVLADWVMAGEQPMDLWVVDIRRFSELHRDQSWTGDRTLEAYGKHYSIGYPLEEYESGRPRIVSPLFERLKERGAVFGAKLGWERANWFVRDGVAPEDVNSFARGNWFDCVGAEHKAAREAVALFDQSSFAKFEMRGSDAEAALTWIAANDVSRPPGRLVYTQMLNSRGGIECDLTVARLATDHYYIVTGTGFRTHDFAWIRQNIPTGLDVVLSDVTEAFGTLSLMGPRSREVLAKVTDADVCDAALPFASVRNIEIAGVEVRALRITYVGELGFELHMPIADTGTVFDRLMEAGAPYAIAPAGYRAIESLRLEKGYRAWGADITPNDNPFHAGLGWAVKLKSDLPFLGRGATEKIANSPLPKRLVTFTVDDPAVMLAGRETILRDGEVVGYLASGGWGYTVGANIGLGYVRNAGGVGDDYLAAGKYELEVACERVPAVLHLQPLYDPENTRVKG
jgi:glycine cleavage system aminomethyltransferase T/glycine/D-amino acid oxidase-like deaminating enzyme